MIINGKQIADEIYTKLEAQGKNPPKLGIVVGMHDTVTESFIRIKSREATQLGIEVRRIDLLHQPTTADALAAIEKLAPEVDGIIVQLPLPASIDIDTVLKAIPPYLDVDGINPAVSDVERIVRAPVAEAIREILSRARVEISGKKCVVVGAGRLVGLPTVELLRSMGGVVSVITSSDGTLDELSDADIIILGAGIPGFIKPEMSREGVVLIDAGTSESGGKVVGDADPACVDKCAVFTPVPGGVGPIAVAMIFKNLFALAPTSVTS